MSNPIKLLVVGSSFAGISAIKCIMKLAPSINRKIQVNVIDPKAGFINILAIPKFIFDTSLAQKWYFDLLKFGVSWNTVWMNKDKNPQKLIEIVDSESNVEFNYIQGYVTNLDLNNATISRSKYLKRNSPKEFSKIEVSGGKDSMLSEFSYDYCILASGRSRNWPFDPIINTKEDFISEMSKIASAIKSKKKITIIGGGGLGIEVAGQLKESFPTKHIQLIHPHHLLPPEPLLSDSFKSNMINQIKESGIELILNTRITSKSISDDGKILLQTTDGQTITTDLDMWCNYHRNNIQYLSENFAESIVKKDELLVNTYFQMLNKSTGTPYENIFAVGDLAALGLIKKAGLARSCAEFAVSNIFELIKGQNHSLKKFEGLSHNNMAIPIGSKRNVVSLNGEIIVNSERVAKKYQDYSCKGVSLKLGLTLPDS